MRARSARIVMSPYRGDCMPKKAIDQRVLSASWAEKMMTPCCTALLSSPFCTMRYRETPIRIYSTVHTGPNAQFGGVNEGFSSWAYHVGIAYMVKKEPITPARRGMAMQRIKSPAERIESLSIHIGRRDRSDGD